MSIDAFQIKNLRSISDTKKITLKPINICVGKNSAGKSTFARFFPLLKQSIEEQKRSPILWYGRLVDFGSFKESLNYNSKTGSISIYFQMQLLTNNFPRLTYNRYYVGRNFFDKQIPFEIEIILKGADNEASGYVSCLEITIYDTKCTIDYSADFRLTQIKVGSQTITTTGLRQDTRIGRILPFTTFFVERTRRREEIEEKILVAHDPFEEKMIQAVKSHLHGASNALEFARELKVKSKADFFDLIKKKTGQKKWDQFTAKLSNVEDKEFNRIHELVIASKLSILLDFADQQIAEYFDGVKYIEPIRASALRYYRKQDLRIDEIDSRGSNVPHFLESLSQYEATQFSDWVNKHLNVRFSADSVTGHITLTVSENEGKGSVNIADSGFGYSQLLPVVVQLWSILSKLRKKSNLKTTSRIVIEQPELHLHPNFQAKIADLIVDVIANNNDDKNDTSIILETHSPHLINRLGELVSSGKIDKSDVIIYLFDKDQTGETLIRKSNFDSKGVLKNWPAGFFDPVLD